LEAYTYKLLDVNMLVAEGCSTWEHQPWAIVRCAAVVERSALTGES